MKHIEVAIGIIESKGKILCVQSKECEYDYLSGKWGFVGGEVEEDKTYEETLVKSINEKIGLDVEVLGHFKDVTYEYLDFTTTLHVYKCKAKGKKSKGDNYHDFKWISVDNLKELDWLDAEKIVVSKLILEKKRKKKPLLFKFIRFIIRLFYKKRELVGVENLLDEPALIIGNHCQLHGPFTAELFFPTYKQIWCRGEMMNLKETPKYCMDNFFSDKGKGVRWFYKGISYVLSPLISYLFSRADTISVYRDSRLINTFRQTLKCLDDGSNIVIFTESEIAYNEIVNEFNDKFVDTARMYYNKTKKELSFIPMYNAVELKKIVFGKPIKYDHTVPIEEQRKIICDYLKEEITRLAKELPPHKVVPFLMTDKKNYPMSK